jgi:hypothetical protein
MVPARPNTPGTERADAQCLGEVRFRAADDARVEAEQEPAERRQDGDPGGMPVLRFRERFDEAEHLLWVQLVWRD